MDCLALSLGHNSSVVLIRDGQIICGYEEERLSRVKSDSSFPIRSLLEIDKHFPLQDVKAVCVGHWFLDGELPPSNKYWKREFIRGLMPKAEILGLHRSGPTHHDSHKLSADVFAGPDFPKERHTMVVDGFGTQGECWSIYHNGQLTHRYRGFYQSVGLLYQYATAYMGMKMHQHEYKMLAFETHLQETVKDGPTLMAIIRDVDFSDTEYFVPHVALDVREDDIGTLKMVQSTVNDLLDHIVSKWTSRLGRVLDEYDRKVLVSFFVQRFVEKVIAGTVEGMCSENLVVVGGTFFNVKINCMLADMIPGKFCAMPLAGDQGAGLGVYQYYFKNLVWPGHLFWGHRELGRVVEREGLYKVDTADDAYSAVAMELKMKKVVNLVRGSMEYGPRALCNTSTLALPDPVIGATINAMNVRTNEMPFALVVTKEQADDLFEGIDKIHESLDYMIVTRRFKPGKENGLKGGAHYYPLESVYTCRPQITDDPFMVKLLNEFGPLINTSFNAHGEPIVFDGPSIESNHEIQRKTFKINTIVEV